MCEFNIGLINIAGLTPEKWENLKKYVEGKKSIDVFVLTETQRGNKVTPDYMLKDGYRLYTVYLTTLGVNVKLTPCI